MYQKKTPETNLCPFEYVLSIFKGKWDIRVLCLLAHNRCIRYGQFKHFLPEISDTVLASVLKKMIDNHIIEKTVYEELPPKMWSISYQKRGEPLSQYYSHCAGGQSNIEKKIID